MAKKLFDVVGTTAEGKPVVAGMYTFYETQGLPLEMLLDKIREEGLQPSWPHTYVEMLLAGIESSRAIGRLEAIIVDAGWDPGTRDEVINRLKSMHKWAETLAVKSGKECTGAFEGVLIRMFLDGTLFVN